MTSSAAGRRPLRPVEILGLGPRALLVVLVTGIAAVLLTFGPAAAALPQVSAASAPGPAGATELIRFTGDGCPKCDAQTEWLEANADRWGGLTVTVLEVWGSAANRETFRETGERLGFDASAVPTTVLGERVWIGWTDAIERDLAAALDRAADGLPVQPGVFGTPGAGTCDEEALQCDGGSGTVISVPLLGEVDLAGQSLLAATVIIGFVDGVNPCSLWAISVLMTIVVRTASRRRVIAVGTTFLLVTAAMYGLFMAGIYSALSVASHLGAIQVVVAVAAGIFGVVSVKDYFAFKKGLSFTIADSAKPGLYKRMRAAAGHSRLGPALLATAGLGVAVALLEAPCTAGFPVLWTGMLQANGVAAGEAGLLFVAYMVPYLIDEFLVFAVVVVTMRAARMQEKHGQALKLVAGVTMLALAGAMVLDPTIMQDPIAALLLFVGAFATTAVIHLVTTRVRDSRARAAGDVGALAEEPPSQPEMAGTTHG